MTPSLYRRPLPVGQIPFASSEGRALFREALALGTLESFFPLIEQFHTQADPAFCGLGSLVMALNALGIDPGRLWRGPWRWFSEELLDCCTPLDAVRKSGISMEELACLARCNGADAEVFRPGTLGVAPFREAVEQAARAAADSVVIVSYSRAGVGQTGAGHFSPLGGYHPTRDLVLLLDVARFKYPPHWLPLQDLHAALFDPDPVTGRSRGWVRLQRRDVPSSLAYFVSRVDGTDIGTTLDRLVTTTRASLRAARPTQLSHVLQVAASSAMDGELLQCVGLRAPETPEHERLFESLRCALTGSHAHEAVVASAGSHPSELVVAWLLAAPAELWTDLPSSLHHEVRALLDPQSLPGNLAAEVAHIRGQIEFLLDHTRQSRSSSVLGART